MTYPSAPLQIIGAGLAGLAAALTLSKAGRKVLIREAAPHAGGRCRSYEDPVIGSRIDNGNHLILSGNSFAKAYLTEIGSLKTEMVETAPARFDFVDLQSGVRWTIKPGDPWRPWSLLQGDIPPGTSRLAMARDLWRLMRARKGDTLQSIFEGSSAAAVFWYPLGVSALNTEAEAADAPLFASVIRDTLLRGEAQSRPLVARHGLSEAFVQPALDILRQRGAEIRFNDRVKTLDPQKAPPTVLAVPNHGAVPLLSSEKAGPLPQLDTRPIVNAHFRVAARQDQVRAVATVSGLSEWIFHRQNVASVTVSAAQRLLGMDQDELLEKLWQEAQTALQIDEAYPQAQRLLVEKRATIAQTPDELKKRQNISNRYGNIFIAGDYSMTALPATIEGSIKSGREAAERLLSSV